jgi:hypothetical protein
MIQCSDCIILARTTNGTSKNKYAYLGGTPRRPRRQWPQLMHPWRRRRGARAWGHGGGTDEQGHGGAPAKGPRRYQQGLGTKLASGAQVLQIANGREMENEEDISDGRKRGEENGEGKTIVASPVLTATVALPGERREKTTAHGRIATKDGYSFSSTTNNDCESISASSRSLYFHIVETLANASVSTKPNPRCFIIPKVSPHTHILS